MSALSREMSVLSREMSISTPATTFFLIDGNRTKIRGAAMGCESGVVDVRTDVGEAERGGASLCGPPSAGAGAGGQPCRVLPQFRLGSVQVVSGEASIGAQGDNGNGDVRRCRRSAHRRA